MKTLSAILIVLFAMSVGAMETPAEEKAPEIKQRNQIDASKCSEWYGNIRR